MMKKYSILVAALVASVVQAADVARIDGGIIITVPADEVSEFCAKCPEVLAPLNQPPVEPARLQPQEPAGGPIPSVGAPSAADQMPEGLNINQQMRWLRANPDAPMPPKPAGMAPWQERQWHQLEQGRPQAAVEPSQGAPVVVQPPITVEPVAGLLVTPTPGVDDLSWLHDSGLPFPRITTAGAVTRWLPDYKNFDAILGRAEIATGASAKPGNPGMKLIYWVSPNAYQDYVDRDPFKHRASIPFATSGSVTDGRGSVFAGHWRYKTAQKSTTPLDAQATQVTVDAPGTIKAKDYVVIYDAPTGSFRNAEHAEVTAVAGNKLTLKRGHKSQAVPHPIGSIIAEHDLGQGVNPELWGYNMSNVAPRDANGKLMNEAFADWMAGVVLSNQNFDGAIFDADFKDRTQGGMSDLDINNDGKADEGFDPVTGTPWWREGYMTFYTNLRKLLGPTKLIVGGAKGTGGYGVLSGNQFEGFPSESEQERPGHTTPQDGMNTLLSNILWHSYGNGTSHYSEMTMKRCTHAFQKGGSCGVESMRNFRLPFATAQIMGSHYGDFPQPNEAQWYDEYAVNPATGVPDKAHLHWLGLPISKPQRIAKVGRELFSYDFSSPPSAIREHNAHYEIENGVLDVVPTKFYLDWHQSTLSLGPTIPAGEHTAVFRARADAMRDIHFTSKGRANVIIGPEWHTYAVVINSNGRSPLVFQLGRENIGLQLDDVKIIEGNASVFYRQFEHGVAVANYTDKPVTVNLGEPLRRIKGTQDSGVNSGESHTDGVVTIPAWDGLVLLRAN